MSRGATENRAAPTIPSKEGPQNCLEEGQSGGPAGAPSLRLHCNGRRELDLHGEAGYSPGSGMEVRTPRDKGSTAPWGRRHPGPGTRILAGGCSKPRPGASPAPT